MKSFESGHSGIKGSDDFMPPEQVCKNNNKNCIYSLLKEIFYLNKVLAITC